MEINVETLISKIYTRPTIWDKKSKNHHNRILVDKLWRTISIEMKIPKDQLKKKWKCLRDQFRLECKKIPISKSGDFETSEAEYNLLISWPYFKSLLFLKGQMTCRKTSGNLTTNISEINDFNGEESYEAAPQESVTSFVPEPDTFEVLPPNQPSKKKKIQPCTNSEFLAIEKRKLELLENKVNKSIAPDEDQAFFNSLLPHIRQLQPREKFLCRMELEKVMFRFVYITSQQAVRHIHFKATTQEWAEPGNLTDKRQNISLDSNVASSFVPPNQNQNVDIADLKRAASTAANAPTKSKIERRPEQRDASDSLGAYVAAKHRQYTDYVKSYVEHDISQVFFEADMGKYEQPLGPWQGQGIQQQVSAAHAVSNTNSATTNATNSRAAYNTNGDLTKTTTAQYSIAAVEQSVVPNIFIKTSPAHTPSYTSDMEDNDDESETVLSNTGGAPPYVADERMSDDDQKEEFLIIMDKIK